MKRIKTIIEKIKNAIIKLFTYNVKDELTYGQKSAIYDLNEHYNLLLDVIENDIELMHVEYLSHSIDEGSYRRKQDEIANRLATLKQLYLQEYEAILG